MQTTIYYSICERKMQEEQMPRVRCFLRGFLCDIVIPILLRLSFA